MTWGQLLDDDEECLNGDTLYNLCQQVKELADVMIGTENEIDALRRAVQTGEPVGTQRVMGA